MKISQPDFTHVSGGERVEELLAADRRKRRSDIRLYDDKVALRFVDTFISCSSIIELLLLLLLSQNMLPLLKPCEGRHINSGCYLCDNLLAAPRRANPLLRLGDGSCVSMLVES
jgi:hypothetical protein